MKPVPIAKYFDRMARHDKTGVPVAPRSLLLASGQSKRSQGLEEKIREAYDRGVRDGHASASSESAVAAEMENIRREQRELEEIRSIRAAEHAAIVEKIEAGLLGIEERVSATAARILSPYLKAECARSVARALSESLLAMFGSNAPGVMKISGPAGELEELRQRLASAPVEVVYSNDGNVDVSIQMDDTTIRTQLEKWIAAIDSASA